MKQQRLFFILFLCLVILVGVFAVQQYAFAQIAFGGKVVNFLPYNPVGPCLLAPGLFCYYISPPNPTLPSGALWLAPFPPPPIGAWVLGYGAPTAIIIGGWGF